MSKINSQPFFSIVIANYNHGRYISFAIESVINQSFKNFELIIIDAQSTDNSLEVIHNYKDKISWWVSEPDSGQSEAFNKGFNKAKGKFIFWLNADDIILKDSLQNLYSSIIKDNFENHWYSANTIFFDENGLIKKCTNGPKWNDFLIKKSPLSVYGPSSIFSKEIFDAVSGFDEELHFGMDTDLWYRFKSKGYKFKKINKYFWGFRVHNDSKTSHAFLTEKNPDFHRETIKIKEKNNIKFSKVYFLLLKLLKLVNGNYLKSYFDTFKLKNKHISNF